MYKTFLLALLLVSKESSSQTLEETIKWINSKFLDTEISPRDQFGNKDSYTHVINKSGSFTRTKTKVRKGGGGYTLKFTGNFKHLNPESITTEKDESNDDLFYIDIYCSNGKECIDQITVDEPDEKFDLEIMRFGPFKEGEKDLVNRLIKAFKHLIKLFGGKKETF